MISALQNGREWRRSSVDAVQWYLGSRWKNEHRGWGAENAVRGTKGQWAMSDFMSTIG